MKSLAGIQRIRITNKEYPFIYVMGPQELYANVYVQNNPAVNWTYVLM